MPPSIFLRALVCTLSVFVSVLHANQLCSALDCDENGIPDHQEIAADPSRDADGNGVLDICEQCAEAVIYTTDNDFLQGTTAAVIIDGGTLRLDLSRTSRLYPYVNVACSGRGTVVRVDAQTGVVVGEYWTAPEFMGRDPSRTTVDHNGNVWVANRAEGGGGKGSVTRIALVTGPYEEDETGRYYYRYSDPPPYTGGLPWEELDRNGDDRIRTSKGLGHILGWTNAGGKDTNGGVSTSEDELIVTYTRTNALNVRTLAVDGNNDVWVGGPFDYSPHIHEKIDGTSGLLLEGTRVDAACGGYGGLIDHNGVLWSATSPWRYDPASPETQTCLSIPGCYGLAIDPRNGQIWSSGSSSPQANKIDPLTGQILQSVPQPWPAKGIAVDCNGHVWIVQADGTQVLRLDPDPVTEVHSPAAVISGFEGTTGVCVDMFNKIWVTEKGADRVSRIDPVGGGIDHRIDLGNGAGPYNYSDMAGTVSAQLNTTGTWVVSHDSQRPGARWGRVSWAADTPPGTSIRIFVRAAKTRLSFAGHWTEILDNGGILSTPLVGGHLQIRVLLKGTGTGACGDLASTPVLYDLTVWPQLSGGDCQGDGIDDACQLNFNDCNDNLVPDDCELDSDRDGVINECERPCSDDCNQNGIMDADELSPQTDSDGNGILDDCEGCPQSQTYETDLDFQEGTGSRIVIEGGTITVDIPSYGQYPYVNVACSQRGTVARIDAQAGTVVGEYWTAPQSRAKDPSRTTVDHYGNVWVANRAEAGGGKGSVTRIALLIGGVRGDKLPDGTFSINPQGEYILPDGNTYTSITLSQLDRDGDGLIRTSRALGHILPWTDPGENGPLSTAEDELIITYTRTNATAVRTMAVDGNNDLWVGGPYDSWPHIHEKIDGATGLLLDGTRVDADCGGYGGLIDHNGVLWSAKGPWRYDPASGAQTCLGIPGNYGLAIDPRNGQIWSSAFDPPQLDACKIDPQSGQILQRVAQPWAAKGIAVDCNGHVWIAQANGTQVLCLAPDPVTGEHSSAGTIPGFDGTTGVCVDMFNKIWVTEKGANRVSRIDPVGGGIDHRVDLGDGAGPYNYSDMAGTVSAQLNAMGTWTAIHNGGIPRGRWNYISWDETTPQGTSVTVRARAAETQAGLESRPWTSVANGVQMPQPLIGRYIQVHATLTATTGVHPCGGGLPADSAVLERITVGTIGDDLNQNGVLDVCENLRYVKADATGGNHGMTWADAYTDLNTALEQTPERAHIWVASAKSGDQIVAYTPGSTSASTFLVSRSVALFGGFSGTETRLADRSLTDNPTILSGELGTTNAMRVVTVTSMGGERAEVTLDGFIIRKAQVADFAGGGVRIENGDCTIRNCRLEHNQSPYGSALAVVQGATISMTNVVAVANASTHIDPYYRLSGALFVDDTSRAEVVNSTLVGNHAAQGAAGIMVRSGGSLQLLNSILWLNRTARVASASAQLEVEEGADLCAAFNCIQHHQNGHLDGTLSSYPGFIRAPYPGFEGLWDDGDDLGNLRLRRGSHCINAGNMAALPKDLDDLDSDGVRCEMLPIDISGGPRIIADPTSGRMAVDIGAYQFDPYADDCNGNGVPDSQELIPGRDCDSNGWLDECEIGRSSAFDFDQDCEVNQDDFAFLQRCFHLHTASDIPDDCRVVDVNLDLQIGYEDVRLFMICASGPGIVANGLCQDFDSSGLLDVAEADFDGDGLIWDNCPWVCNVPVDYSPGDSRDDCAIALGLVKDGLWQPDFDCDGVGDACDNCPLAPNPDQLDSNQNGLGDACDASPPPPSGVPPVVDADEDGIPDHLDNCPAMPNPDQADADGDGIGDACDADIDGDGVDNELDNCPWHANSDQTDTDGDGVGDVCDNCPNAYNPLAEYMPGDSDVECAVSSGLVYPDGFWQPDYDCDWVGDACDNCEDEYNWWQDDDDGDGIGNECDNCAFVYNPDQADADSNGIGDACEEGLLLGGQMMAAGTESSTTGETPVPHQENLPMPQQGAFAYFIAHGGSDQSVDLPASGGTVVVDLVVATADPLQSWDVHPATNAANVIAIDAAGWTPQLELLTWAYDNFGIGEPPPAALPSYYNCSLLDWDIRNPEYRVICRSTVQDGACVQSALEPGNHTWTGIPGMDAVGGPMNLPLDAAFVAQSGFGGITQGTFGPGTGRVATLTLHAAGIPGTYDLWLAYGSYHSAAEGISAEMQPGPVFRIDVARQ